MKQYEIGEKVSVEAIVYRKWWQFWKPRVWTERRVYQVTDVIPK